ncbi:MAG: phosphoribosyl-ATP diphosphatase [Pseudomonadota bacterium]|jgi:phosphoribosyl-ATP pyrophosphohydrolase
MTEGSDVLTRLYQVIAARKGADPAQSYVARLYAKGRLKLAQKLGEEAVETALAAVAQEKSAVIAESADLLFHLMVLWADLDIEPSAVMAELARREGVSGFAQKAKRKRSSP